MRKLFFYTILLAFSSLATANNNNNIAETLLKSLESCEPNFFNTIYENQDILRQYVPVDTINRQQAYISVKNREHNHDNYTLFEPPLTYKNITIKGYYDSVITLGKYGDYYFWGLIFDNNNIAQVKESLSFIKWQEIEFEQLYLANTKIRHISDRIEQWHINNEIKVGVKTVPEPGSAEKFLLLEKTPNAITFACSIQGFLPPELLSLERPDIQN